MAALRKTLHGEGYSPAFASLEERWPAWILRDPSNDARRPPDRWRESALNSIAWERPGCDPTGSRGRSLFRESKRVPIQRQIPHPVLRPSRPPRRLLASRQTLPLPLQLCRLLPPSPLPSLALSFPV